MGDIRVDAAFLRSNGSICFWPEQSSMRVTPACPSRFGRTPARRQSMGIAREHSNPVTLGKGPSHFAHVLLQEYSHAIVNPRSVRRLRPRK
jgi:hypothetical protein